MATAPATSPLPSPEASTRRVQLPGSLQRPHLAAGVGLALLAMLIVIAVVLNHNWPYRYRNVKPLLENVFASQIDIKKYHRTYFPRPGFVAHGLTLHRKSNDPDLPALGTANTLIVQSGWLDLVTFRKHVQVVDVEGLRVVLPPTGSKQRAEDFPPGSSSDFSGPTTSIGKLSLRDAVLEIQDSGGGKSLVFPVAKLIVHNMVRGQPLRYTLDLTNPIPTGHVLAKGTFGPINSNDLGSTPLSGDFQLQDARLDDIGKLHGLASATGHFDHTLAAIAATATTTAPKFSVGDGRPTPLKSDVRCTINGLNGDVVLNSVESTLGNTRVHVDGSITGKPKLARLELRVPHGRAQDLMQPFDHDRPPVTGAVSLQTHAEILPAHKGEDFLARLRMDGSFDIPAERITNPATEKNLSAFSERAQGDKNKGTPDDPPDTDVLSSLAGPVTLRNGVVSTERMRFIVPGATADLHGNYSLRNKQVHMTGNLTMQSDISHVTTGFKSALLKPFAPFFKHKQKPQPGPAVTVVPMAITGGPGSYKVSGNLLHNK